MLFKLFIKIAYIILNKYSDSDSDSDSITTSPILSKSPPPSGVVGSFLLWERSHGIMVTYPIVTRGKGWYLNEWSFIKGKNPYSKIGV